MPKLRQQVFNIKTIKTIHCIQRDGRQILCEIDESTYNDLRRTMDAIDHRICGKNYNPCCNPLSDSNQNYSVIIHIPYKCTTNWKNQFQFDNLNISCNLKFEMISDVIFARFVLSNSYHPKLKTAAK